MLEIDFKKQAFILRVIESCKTNHQIDSALNWLAKLDYDRFKGCKKQEIYSMAKSRYYEFYPPEPIRLGHESGVKYETK